MSSDSCPPTECARGGFRISTGLPLDCVVTETRWQTTAPKIGLPEIGRDTYLSRLLMRAVIHHPSSKHVIHALSVYVTVTGACEMHQKDRNLRRSLVTQVHPSLNLVYPDRIPRNGSTHGQVSHLSTEWAVQLMRNTRGLLHHQC